MCDNIPKTALDRMFEVMSCNSNIEDPNATEAAFINLLNVCGYNYKETIKTLMPNEKSYNRFLFTSMRKKSATILKKNGGEWLYTFGTVHKILEACDKILDKEGGELPLTKEKRDQIARDISVANGKALRTLGIASKPLQPGEGGDDHMETAAEEIYKVEQSGLTFLGYVGLKDPLREGVRPAVNVLHGAGITIRMVTGDTRETAIAIAKDCGILPKDITDVTKVAMTGTEFSTLVGGLKYRCPKCDEKAEAEPDKIVKIDMEIDKEVKKEVKKEEVKKDKKMEKCRVCDTELEGAAANMKEFKEIVKTLMVIACCSPADKYLLVSGLKYM